MLAGLIVVDLTARTSNGNSNAVTEEKSYSSKKSPNVLDPIHKSGFCHRMVNLVGEADVKQLPKHKCLHRGQSEPDRRIGEAVMQCFERGLCVQSGSEPFLSPSPTKRSNSPSSGRSPPMKLSTDTAGATRTAGREMVVT